MTIVGKWRLLWGLNKTHKIIDMALEGVTQEDATIYRDGPEGWNTLEIMCHLRDFQAILMQRVQRMVNEDNPTIVPYDPHELLIKNDYAHQDLRAVYDDFLRTRADYIALVESLEEEQLWRPGIHPEDGDINVLTIVLHTILHDDDHIEQMMRVLEQRDSYGT